MTAKQAVENGPDSTRGSYFLENTWEGFGAELHAISKRLSYQRKKKRTEDLVICMDKTSAIHTINRNNSDNHEFA